MEHYVSFVRSDLYRYILDPKGVACIITSLFVPTA